MQLRNRITISYGVITAVVLVGTAALISVGSNYMIKRVVEKNVYNTTAEAGYILDDYLSDVEDITALVFSDDEVAEYNHDKYIADEYEKLQTEEKITDYLNSISVYKSYSDFAIFYKDGEYLGQASSTTDEIFKDENVYEKLALRLEDKNESWFTGYKGNYRRMYYAKRLNNSAIVLTSFFYRELDDIFTAAGTTTKMQGCVIADGANIYATNTDKIGKAYDAELVESVRNDKTGAFEQNDLIVSYYECANGWLLITFTSEDSLNEISGYITRVTVFAILGAAVIIFLAGLLIANSITKPITGMADAISEVEGGNFDVKIPDGSTKEIHTLSEGLTDMIASVKENMKLADDANKEKLKFLANTTHEIRTPMNAILGYSEMIIDEGDAASIERASTIKNAAKNLLTIVNDILDFSKIESGKVELKEDNYHIETVIDEVAGIIKIPAGQKGLDLQAEILNKFPATLYGDDIKIRQILINLANNAIKFTDNGYVRITGKCEKIKDDDEKVKMIFKVIDSGIGIRPEDIGKVFGAFEQVDSKANRKKEGSGLGLSIAKQFAHMMNGDITVESEYGRGTIFTVEIEGKVVSWLADEEKPVDVAGKKILIVDDAETNLLMFENMLKPYHVEIDKANCGERVLELVDKKAYDLIFMDHYMPDMNGDDVTREIRARKDEAPRFEAVPIIGYTADDDADSTRLMLGAGMNDCVMKPVSIKKLESLFRKFLMTVLICVMVFPASACTISDALKGDETEIVEKSKIKFSWWGDDDRHDYTLDLLEKFEKIYPEIDIVPSYTELGTYESRTKAMFAAGKEPDIMQIDYNWLSTYSEDGNGFYDLYDLLKYIDLSTYNGKYLEYGTRYSKLNAIPVALDSEFLYGNLTLLGNLGFTMPRSWDDLDKLGEAVKGSEYAAISIDSVEELLYLLVAYTEQVSGNPMYTEDGTLGFGKAEYEIMLEKYLDLIDKGVIKPFGGDTFASFEEQKSPLTIGWITESSDICSPISMQTTVSVATFPVLTDTNRLGLYARASALYAISDETKHPKEAATFMNYLLFNMDAIETSGVDKGAPIQNYAVSLVKAVSDSSNTPYRAAQLLYLTDLEMQEPRMNSATNLALFEDVFSAVGYERMTIEEGVNTLFINMY